MNRLKLLVGVAISVALFVYLFWSVDLHELGVQLLRTRWQWVVLAVILAPLGPWTRSRRWWYLFPPRSHPPGLGPATMIGYMANNVLPLRAGEFVRVYVVARRWGHGFWTVLATLVVERVLDSLVIVLVMAALVLRIPVPTKLQVAALIVLAIDVAAVGTLVFLAIAPETARRIVRQLTRRWPALEHRLLGILETFVRGLEGVRTRAHLVPLVAWTAIIWMIQAVSAWAMFRAMSIALPWIAGWTVVAFVGLGVAVPSAPGYIGVFHAAAVLALAIFGVAPTAALGYALLYHATQIVPITLVGWVYLLREQITLADVSRARPAEELG